ncbi:16S rRNA (cytidine(1402)-2'-O)-methyltransferase [Weissella paramesenteroides]|jgi:16S rRNA (cytidine1402-2'-O)-methyltransferase|uniref:Ribosomal RNA small subunit methyltransferase I n=2 Tax=Weissella paramesenteroides TaxID=1249 RepID=A0ABD4XG35_WEIPA|nr:16S rRNA (cytidine(1402)-2'-O)-methyltransferase [Weissella paramesenteroides]KAA8447432.1 16S rRNA (cytidine(1402)-2'-O)-methyltransferase [Weissella paramesenteroides]KAA8451264.1 16S rRNA (cytidine(1402)-2'-O)-methyltransferase [Weissella paramesenteroides]KAA8457022.1 16S rRNA (cytidine(1402)-2'-O)-methyltransferase [Weissella paramesenteroides]KAA8458555.1 16S rRNA (cytidine(1402)-2'-O)-methyltransferase [Weissella paramesenteroides]KAA8460462.1 16S rRNA (cytidine(1402)-2'-O)-methyltra
MKQQKSFGTHTTGTLYLVPTPIGNLGDMTNRSIQVMQDVDVIAAEDTRHTQQLLNQFEITTKQISFHEHNKETRIPELVARLQAGDSIAQVSDAGMPSISDPGHELVKAAILADVPVVPIPGASAGITALIASGLAPQPFMFYGFLPRKPKEQLHELDLLKTHQETMIFYEAPHRLAKTLQSVEKVFGAERQVVLARELTKRYEEFLRGTIAELVAWATSNEVRGEFVVIVSGNDQVIETSDADPLAELSAVDAVKELVENGLKPTAAIKQIAKQRSLDRQTLYLKYQGENK